MRLIPLFPHETKCMSDLRQLLHNRLYLGTELHIGFHYDIVTFLLQIGGTRHAFRYSLMKVTLLICSVHPDSSCQHFSCRYTFEEWNAFTHTTRAYGCNYGLSALCEGLNHAKLIAKDYSVSSAEAFKSQ